MSDASPGHGSGTHNQPATLVVYRALLGRLLECVRVLVPQSLCNLCAIATHLVFEEGIPDILRHLRHGQNVVRTLFVVLVIEATVERVPVIPNQPESTRKESAWQRVGPNLPTRTALPGARPHSRHTLHPHHPPLSTTDPTGP